MTDKFLTIKHLLGQLERDMDMLTSRADLAESRTNTQPEKSPVYYNLDGSKLVPLIQNAIAGAAAQKLTDPEIRDVIMAIIADDDRFLNTAEAAEYLNYSLPTLKRWRKIKAGPRYRREPNGRVQYKMRWLKAYADSGTI